MLGLVWWGDGSLGPILFPFSSWQQGPQEEKQGSHSVGGAAHAVSATCGRDLRSRRVARGAAAAGAAGLGAGSAGRRGALSPRTGSPGPRRAHRVRDIAPSPV